MTAKYDTTLPNAALGLLVGALAGTILYLAGSSIVALLFGAPYQHGSVRWPDLLGLLFASAYVVGVWLTGLLVIAGPFWLTLHALRLRGPISAVSLGTVLTFVFVAGFVSHGFGLLGTETNFSASDGGGQTIENGILTAYGWRRAFEYGGWMSPLGAAVGLVVWRVAYRRVTPE